MIKSEGNHYDLSLYYITFPFLTAESLLMSSILSRCHGQHLKAHMEQEIRHLEF